MKKNSIYSIYFDKGEKNLTVYDLIVQRRTIRRFKQVEISEESLTKIVNAGRLAPSGANLQPLEFIIIHKKGLLKPVFSTLKWAGYIAPAGNPPVGSQPVAYIVVLINSDIKKDGGSSDAAAAIENMIFAALDQGIGSCWIGSISRKDLRARLNIPQNYRIDSVLAMGYPDESPVVEEVKNSIKYWKDEEGTLHVPKRNLNKIIHFNMF